ncbi:Signaling protein YkoW [Alteripontixanthobacter maritimus]|uniref:Signaling protein YkoW n=1 Tax=Alteripontixanthobacter maritimus TaxID=2161824 RepID=A0A369QAB1_9SPHN|nr:EAL domain-containing protein [Alteripontixanthobacter maritimus]RDC60146.1 Signaling protein YkoW [Alteripontixanthobacter maritimus]
MRTAINRADGENPSAANGIAKPDSGAYGSDALGQPDQEAAPPATSTSGFTNITSDNLADDHSGPPLETDERRGAAPDHEKRNLVKRVHATAGGNAARTDAASDEKQYFMPQGWGLMGLFMLVAVVLAGLVALTMPSSTVLISGAGAVALAGLGRYSQKLERREGAPFLLRIFLMVLSVPMPMFLFGLTMALWALAGNVNWYWAVGSIVALNIAGTTLLKDRLVSSFCLSVAAWSGLVVVDGTGEAFTALAAGSLVLLVITRYQRRKGIVILKEEEARERIRNRAEDILRDYEETGQGWFWESDRRGRITYLTTGVAQTIGQEKSALIGRPFGELFDLGDINRESERTLTFQLSARSAFKELAVRAASSAEERWWSVSGRPIYDNFGNFVGFRGSGTDLTEKRRSQQNESRLAHFDSLTGLANRFQMSQTMEKILSAPQEMHRECSVMLLDLDRFKHVNDTLGHPAGDALLKQVAQRLNRTVGKAGRVGRIGGDEFQVILAGRADRTQLAQLSKDVIHSLSQPYSIDGQRVVIGASVGIAVSPDNGVSDEALIRNADLALYAAKDGGRGRHHFYADDLHSAAEERTKLENDLRDAIAAGDLELYYQPQVNTKTEQISGFEALVRWKHATQGWLSPEKFIPVAEDTGLITALGEWAIRTACHDLARWPDNLRCAVNVSPLQFANPNLPTVVTNAIAQAGIAPGRLELEITESVFLNDSDNTDAMFASLKRIGVRLALDDFGTGYSSLGYLKTAPFDKIKIDKSFISGATEPGNRNGAIIAAITSLAEALDMDTTAEGVETLDELELVNSLGCSHVQGYIYARPLSAQATLTRIGEGLDAHAVGPKSHRAPRYTTLRKVSVEHEGTSYQGTIRNISVTGARIEGLWNVPEGTRFTIALSSADVITCIARWSKNEKMGVEFDHPLELANNGTIVALDIGETNAKPVMRRSA